MLQIDGADVQVVIPKLGEDLKPFRRAADAIESSDLKYTIVRPAWLMDEDEVDYELTVKGAPFKGTVVSRKSVADLIAKVISAPDAHVGESLGVNKPGSEGTGEAAARSQEVKPRRAAGVARQAGIVGRAGGAQPEGARPRRTV